MRKRLFSDKVVVVMLSSAVVLVAIGVLRMNESVTVTVSDGPLYESVDQLIAEADAVVVGRVGGIVSRFDDLGGDPAFDERGDPIPKLKKLIVQIEVGSVLSGSLDQSTISVVISDTTAVIDDWTPQLLADESVALFLFEVPVEQGSEEIQAQGRELGPLYGVVGGNQGVFDVDGGRAFSRSELNTLGMLIPNE